MFWIVQFVNRLRPAFERGLSGEGARDHQLRVMRRADLLKLRDDLLATAAVVEHELGDHPDEGEPVPAVPAALLDDDAALDADLDLVFRTSVRWARKPVRWEAPTIADTRVLEALGRALAAGEVLVVDANEPFPCADFLGGPRPRYHVARRRDGARFLVNTEGYSYARYLAALPADYAAWVR